MVTHSPLQNSTVKSDKLLNGPWRSVSTSPRKCSSGADSYKSISEILNVTTSGKEDSSSTEEIISDRIKEAQSSAHFSGPGGVTKSGVILGIETSADDTGKMQINLRIFFAFFINFKVKTIS